MNGHELGIRFTNEKYATKSEVSKELQISLIDKIWNEILEYRSYFNEILRIKTIDGPNFSICMFPSLMNRINKIEKRISKLNNSIKNINDGKPKWDFGKQSSALILGSVAKHLNISIDNDSLLGLASNNTSTTRPEYIVLNTYCSLLSRFKNGIQTNDNNYSNVLNDIVIEFLGKGNSFYRTKNLLVNNNNIYNGVYNEAPFQVIGTMMDNLLQFLTENSMESSYLLQMAIVIFYLIYLKPYVGYNEEISFIFAKYLMKINDLDECASIINIEDIVNNVAKYDSVFEETQKSCDFTYFMILFLNTLEESIDKVEELVRTTSISEIKNDYYKPDEQSTDVKEVEIVKPVVEEKQVPKFVKEEKSIEPFEINNEVKTPTSKDELLFITRDAAITSVTLGYSEEEAQKVEVYLLESDPNLTQSQAYFYARHCTMNKYYTISQYKNALRCAYETARTSMDKLVFNGYYKKEAHKNKFIYTPVRKK